MDIKKQLLKPVEKIPFNFMSDAELAEFGDLLHVRIQHVMSAYMAEVNKRVCNEHPYAPMIGEVAGQSSITQINKGR